MLPNKVLLNQSISDIKQEAVAKQSRQNSHDRKFEDAMDHSRQQQDLAQQKQQAARNDQSRQDVQNQNVRGQDMRNQEIRSHELRNQKSRSQESRKQAELSQEQNQNKSNKNSPNETRDKTEVVKSDKSNQVGKVAHDKSEKAVSEKSVDETTTDISKKSATPNLSNEQSETIVDSKEQGPTMFSNLSKSTDNSDKLLSVDNVNDESVNGSSWLDTVMKIVADNKSKTPDISESEEIVIKSNSSQSNKDSELNTLLMDAEQSAVKKLFSDFTSLTPEQQKDDSEIQFTDLTNLLAQQMKQKVEGSDVKTVTHLDLESQLSQDKENEAINNTKLTELSIDPQLAIEPKLAGALLEDTALTNGAEASGAKGKVDADELLVNNAVQTSVNNALQQNTSRVTEQPLSILEQSTKSTTNVLNFVNPALLDLNKLKSQTSTELTNNLSQLLSNGFEGNVETAEPEVSNNKGQKLSSEMASLLEMRSVLSSGMDLANNKSSETYNKPETIDVNGVQLDKSLQLPKMEHVSQVKSESLLRENILFNKQELATHMQQQIGLMMSKNMKSIDIRLDPPELGAMQIKLSMNNEQAAVSFVVSNQQAKDALDASLPKLREMLEQQGLDLAESDVHQGSSQNEAGTETGDGSQNGANNLSSEEGQIDDELLAQEVINRTINSPWNVDYYA